MTGNGGLKVEAYPFLKMRDFYDSSSPFKVTVRGSDGNALPNIKVSALPACLPALPSPPPRTHTYARARDTYFPTLYYPSFAIFLC